MRRLTRFLALIVAVGAVGLVACDDDGPVGPPASVEQVTISPQSATLQVGGSIQFVAQVQTTGDAAETVNWSSSNSGVVTVDQNGVATAQSAGSASIIATSTENPNKSAAANVTVEEAAPAKVSISGWRAVSEDPDDTDGGSIGSPSKIGTECENPCDGEEDFVILEVDASVDGGGRTLESLELLMNGDVRSEQTFTDQGEMISAQGSQDFTLSINTLRSFDPEGYEGNVIVPTVPNGEYELGVRATFADGTTRTASLGQTNSLEVENHQQLIYSVVTEPNTVVDDDGDRWFGGTTGTFSVTVVDHYQTGVGSITLESTSPWDIGGGAGSPVTLTDEPFQFTTDPAANAGNESVSDGFMEFFLSSGASSITTAEGEQWDDFFAGAAQDAFEEFARHPFLGVPQGAQREDSSPELSMDYCAPAVDSDSEMYTMVLADGSVVDILDQFFSAGTFSVEDVTGCGAEEFIASTMDAFNFQIDVTDTGTGDVFTDVETVGDLTERTNTGYEADLASLEDVLGNGADVSPAPTSDDFGVDRTPLAITGVAPDGSLILNPDDDNGDGDDQDLEFSASDPVLADGNPGSGYGTSVASAEHADGTTASPAVSPDASGANEVETGGLKDGSWTVEVAHSDLATLPNFSGTVYGFIIDQTDPTTNVFNPPSSSVSTSDDQATFTLEGEAEDANGLSEVLLTIREDLSGDPDGDGDACDVADPLVPVGSGPGEVEDTNTVDVTATAQAGDRFSHNFTVNKDAGTTQHLCFFIEADDVSVDVNGDPEPNEGNLSVHTDVTWN